MTQKNINMNQVNVNKFNETQDLKMNDYQNSLDSLNSENNLRQLEENKLEEILLLCQSYNEAQSKKKYKSFTLDEGDLILNQKLSQLLPWIRNKNSDSDFKYINEFDEKKNDNDNNEEENENKVKDGEGKEESKDKWDNNFEALNSLIMEKGLVKSEIEELKSQHFNEVDDEELKEFQKIEKDLRLNELYKCLKTIDKQIIKYQKEYCGLWSQFIQKPYINHQTNQDNFFSDDCNNDNDNNKDEDENGVDDNDDNKDKEKNEGENDDNGNNVNDNNEDIDDEDYVGDDDEDYNQKIELENDQEYEHRFRNFEESDLGLKRSNRQKECFIYTYQSKPIEFNEDQFLNESNNNLTSTTESETGNKTVNFRPIKKQNQRPLTLYLPSSSQNLDLLNHIQTLGHDISSCKNLITLTSNTCSGYLWKLCLNSENRWRKRFFHFDRVNKVLIYYRSKKSFQKSKKPKFLVFFEDIQDIYVNHNRINSSNLKKKQRHVFVIVTSLRHLTLSLFIPEVMRIWIDVIFTGAEGYLEFE